MNFPEKNESCESAFGLEVEDDDLTDLGKIIKYGNFPKIKEIFDMVVAGQPCVFLRGKNISFLEFLFLARGSDESLISGIMAILSCQQQGQRVALIDLNAWERFSPLHAAAAYGYLDVVKRLINLGADLDAKTIDGASVIHCTVGKYNHMLFPKMALGRKSSFERVLSGNFQLVAATEWKMKRSSSYAGEEPDFSISPRTNSRISVFAPIRRLEILKMIIEKTGPSIIYVCDSSGKMARDYDDNGDLTVFLDGCSEDRFQNKELYKKVYTFLMDTESHSMFSPSVFFVKKV